MRSTLTAAMFLTSAVNVLAQQSTTPGNNILGRSHGSVVLSVSSSYGSSWTAANLADGNTGAGWSSAQGAVFPHTVVFELPQPYAIASIAVDNTGAQEGGYPGISSRRVTVYGSTTSFATGFTQLTALEARRGGRTEVKLGAPLTARWLKFVVSSNWGNAEFTEIMELEAYGQAVDPASQPAARGEAGQTPTGQAPPVKPGEGVWANYDFVPGDRIIFFEDFASDNVGDFPRRFEFKGGNMEVVEWQGERYLRANGSGKFRITLPEVLPERFTVEFDYYFDQGGNLWLEAVPEATTQTSWVRFDDPGQLGGGYSHWTGGVYGPVPSEGSVEHHDKGHFLHARIMADGRYVKVYLNDRGAETVTRVANVPNANLGRSNSITVDVRPNVTVLLGNITVAAGGKKLYDALAEQGRVATHGILFDFDSDRLRPESTPTLKQLGGMLTQHPDLKLAIEGHTDNVGSDAANQTLSEKRAAAVKQYLVSTYAIDAGRLTTKGFGASKPAGPNTTPEGRQNNRRVELVKM